MTALTPAEAIDQYLHACGADYHYVSDDIEHEEVVVAHPNGIFVLSYDEPPTVLAVSDAGLVSLA